jgi:hypothetical protein
MEPSDAKKAIRRGRRPPLLRASIPRRSAAACGVANWRRGDFRAG